MTGTPANFIIIGYTDVNGQVLMTAISDVCRVSIDQNTSLNEIQQWGGNMVKTIQHETNVTVTAEARPDGMAHVRADDHATAWRRLFDFWVPPGSAAGVASEDSQSAVNAHFTFNPPKPQPAAKQNPGHRLVYGPTGTPGYGRANLP